MSIKSKYMLYCVLFACGNMFIGFRLLFEAITFSGTGGILNLARADPTRISTGVGSQKYLHAVGGGPPLTFVSTVVVGECHLIEPKTYNTGKMQKLIEGAGIEGEWDRLVGALGQIIDQTEYSAQIQAGYVSFSTSFASPTSGVYTLIFCYMVPAYTYIAISSPGMRRVSAPNPFTRGPSAGNMTHSCHDIG
jgi:hypothetical protein